MGEEEDLTRLLKIEVDKQLSILSNSPESTQSNKEIQTLINYHFDKSKSISIEALFNLGYKPENQREMSIIKLALYLWEYEGNFGFCVDFLCYLLMLNGHDLFSMYKRDYVTSFEDVEAVDISTKCKFLAEHRFEILMKRKMRSSGNSENSEMILLTINL